MKKYIILDGYGWPVEFIKGHPIINFIRAFLWGRKIVNREKYQAEQERLLRLQTADCCTECEGAGSKKA